LRDGAYYGAEHAERGAAHEDVAPPEDVGDASDDGEGYGGGEGVGEGNPDDVWVLGEWLVWEQKVDHEGWGGLTGPISAFMRDRMGAVPALVFHPTDIYILHL
jgi:hypothetical protein